MNIYLIEVPHKSDKKSCEQAAKVFLSTHSPLLSHAYWGCDDGEHKTWIKVEAEDVNQARLMIPALFRASAKITQVSQLAASDLNVNGEFTQRFNMRVVR